MRHSCRCAYSRWIMGLSVTLFVVVVCQWHERRAYRWLPRARVMWEVEHTVFRRVKGVRYFVFVRGCLCRIASTQDSSARLVAESCVTRAYARRCQIALGGERLAGVAAAISAGPVTSRRSRAGLRVPCQRPFSPRAEASGSRRDGSRVFTGRSIMMSLDAAAVRGHSHRRRALNIETNSVVRGHLCAETR